MARDFVLEEAVERYQPDKEKYFKGSEKEYIKEKKRLHAELRRSHQRSFMNLFDIKKDDEDITERRKAILSGEQEQRAIKTLNSYTPEEIETKTILNQMVGSMKGVEDVFLKFQKKSNTGELAREAAGEFSENAVLDMQKEARNTHSSFEDVKASRVKKAGYFKKIYERYEFLGSHRDDRNGVYAFKFGNKATGEIDLFTPGTNTRNKVEKRNNDRAYIGTTNTQKTFLDYAVELDKESRSGKIKGEREYGSGVASTNGHSQGGASSIFAASYMPNVKCLATEPGPITKVGPYVKDNAILAVIPNSGEGAFNYAEKIEGGEFATLHSIAGIDTGTGENQTSLITALAVPGRAENSRNLLSRKQKEEILKVARDGKPYNIHKTNFDHMTDPESARKAFEKMQKYSQAVEPKLSAYLEGKEKNMASGLKKARTDLQDLLKEKPAENVHQQEKTVRSSRNR